MVNVRSGFGIKSETAGKKIRSARKRTENRDELIVIIISIQVVNLIIAMQETCSCGEPAINIQSANIPSIMPGRSGGRDKSESAAVAS